jgi:Cu2+-exporting ATPase
MIAAPGSCWHCGEPLKLATPVLARVGAEMRPVCCHGCRAAAEWIERLGLGDYYRLRSATPPRLSDPVDANARQRPDAERHVVRDLGNGAREVTLAIDGMRCTGCAWLIERTFAALPGVDGVSINAAARRARIAWRSDAITLSVILERLRRIGYRALPLEARLLDDSRRRESRVALKRLLVAAFGAMQAMMFATVLYLGALDPADTSTRSLFHWLAFLVATPVVCYSATPFFAGALRTLRAGQPGMDVPVACAIAAVYLASVVELVRGSADVYFDSVSMFVLFLLGARYVEMRARHRAAELTDALARMTPATAQRRRSDGSLECVDSADLAPGDRVHIGEGMLVPADGLLESALCRVDEALLSGESAPIVRRRGERLVAGSVVVDGPADLCVDRVGAATTLAGISALAERALTERPRLVRASDVAATRFVRIVLALTIVTAVAWLFVEPARAFGASLAVMVAACPCAFALAVPTAVTRALGLLASRGVLVVRTDAIERLASATHVLFDKTGTLTQPELGLANVECRRDEVTREICVRLAAALARESSHPIARAIAACDTDWPHSAATEVEVTNGLGIEGRVEGRLLTLGRADSAASSSGDADRDAVVLADEDGVLAELRLGEHLRPRAAESIAALASQGLTPLLASGDAVSKVEAVARQVGIVEWRARQAPAAKLAWLEQLRRSGARVIAVGDGVNDAPLLAGADVGVAVTGSADLAQAQSDIVLAGGRLDAIAPARELAQQTIAIIRQNHSWALAYNICAIPLAALGFIPPWLAALGMSLSSLGVVLNLQRIGRSRRPPAASAERTGPALTVAPE